MNIIIANTQEFNPQIGGVERVSTTLAIELTKLGHNIFFVAYIISPFSKEYAPAVEQFILPNSKNAMSDDNIKAFTQYVFIKNVEIILNQAGNILDFTQLCVAVKKETNTKLISEIHINPDYKIKGYLDCSFSKLKELSTIRENAKRLIKRICPYKLWTIQKTERQLYQYVYNNSEKIVLLSEKFKPIFSKLIGNINDAKLVAISNPLSFSTNSVDLSIKKKQILYVGRLDYGHKRPDRVLEIWKTLYKKYSDWELIILGDGPAREGLLELSRELRLERIEFAGFKDPQNYYKDASIILMTSSYEGFGMVLIEAAQFGVVPVALDTFESLQDIVDQGVNGYRIPAPFVKNAYGVLANLMSNPKLRFSMATNAIAHSSNFAIEKIAKEWLNLFNCLKF